MIDPATVASLARQFDDSTDGAMAKSRELILMLLEHTAAPFSRDQFTPGHITCTGLVLSPCGGRVLLIHHGRLDRWLLPGGHVEPTDAAIADAARREVIEETGAQLEPGATLIGMDVHGIPPKKNEPYHQHHDLIFRFRAVSEAVEVSHESRAIAWCAPTEFDRYDVPSNVRRCWARSVNYQ
jgi:8-oxo-dGTP pyrophosphatase MutT (NUDIX family)